MLKGMIVTIPFILAISKNQGILVSFLNNDADGVRGLAVNTHFLTLRSIDIRDLPNSDSSCVDYRHV